MNNTWLILALLGAVLAGIMGWAVWYYGPGPREDAPQVVFVKEEESRPVGERLRVCSYNIQDFTDGLDDEARTPEHAARHAELAARIIRQIDPDVLILQEVENGEMLMMLNRLLDDRYSQVFITQFGLGRKDNRADKLNIGVMSRLSLHNVREVDFIPIHGYSRRPPRGFVCFAVDLGPDRRLLVYGVHLKSNFGDKARNGALRRKALAYVRADADRLPQAHPEWQWEVLVAGDMNVDPEQLEFADDPTLTPFADWVDLWRGRPLAERMTLPTRYGDPALEFPPATFDRFIASPELQAAPWVADPPQTLAAGVETNDVKILPGQNDIHVSDHYPIYLDIRRGAE